jgi:hypothetical protein
MEKVSRYIVEHVAEISVSTQLAKRFLEAHDQKLPPVIYPELRVLTADKKTKNRTYYPESSLRGDADRGTGLISFTRPYPIPVIRDHLTGGSSLFGPAESSEIYGRVFKPAQYLRLGNEGFIRALPSITHPEAIEGVLTGRWLTVSLGSQAQSVKCSVCSTELTKEGCDHERGDFYPVEGEGEKECYWIIGDIVAKEISFVISPSDDQAGVLNPNLTESRKQNHISRILVGNANGRIIDLATGNRLEECYNPLLESPTKIFGYRALNRRINKENKMSDTNAQETPVCLGQLYLMWEDDPDYQKPDDAEEAVLTTKARNNLPDSAFCGPNRSFPAHDAAHVRNGLARLSQAKLSPAQKEEVRKCLVSRAKKFGIQVAGEAEVYTHAAKVIDTKYRIELDLYTLPESLSQVKEVLTQVEAIPHTPAEKEKILSRVASHCKEYIDPASWQELFGSLTTCELGEPVAIEVNEENYGLVYSVMKYTMTDDTPEEPKEFGGASNGGASFSVGDLVQATVPHENGHTDAVGRIVEVHVGPYYALEYDTGPSVSDPYKWYAEQELQISDRKEVDQSDSASESLKADADTHVEESVSQEQPAEETPIVETEPEVKTVEDGAKNSTADLLSLMNEISGLKEHLDKAVAQPDQVTPKKLEELEAGLRKSLATNVALYMSILDKPQARGKSQEELVTSLSTRTMESLQDKVQDLLSEWMERQSESPTVKDTTPVDITSLPKLADPTIAGPSESDSTDDSAKVDESDGLNGRKAVLSDIEELTLEEDEDIISIVFPNL